MIDFPTSPAVDTEVKAPSGMTWKWNGTYWITTAGPPLAGTESVTQDYINSFTHLKITAGAFITANAGASVSTFLTWTTVISDPDGWRPTSSDTLTCPATGVYWLGYHINATAPNFVDNPNTQTSNGIVWASGTPYDFRNTWLTNTPLGFMGGPSDGRRDGWVYITKGTTLKLQFTVSNADGSGSATLTFYDASFFIALMR
jgi:hypothetical protein